MHTLNRISSTKLILILIVIMTLLISVSTAQNIGDYKTVYGGTSFSNAAGWQVFTSTGWVNAVTGPQSPFIHDLYVDKMSTADIDFTLTGQLIMSSNANLFVASGRNFLVSDQGLVKLTKITVNGGGRLTNMGRIESAVAGAQLILDPLYTTGSTLENHGHIELIDDNSTKTYNLYMNSFAKLISGPGASITGDGSASSNAAGVYFEIANQGGFDEAMQLQGPNAFNPANYLFNGNSEQVCGLNLPDPVFSITVDNPTKFVINKDVALNPWQNAFFHIVEGSTVDMGTHIIYSQNWGNASFKLDSGATILTAHPEGISSEVMYQKIYLGCIQTNEASYSSEANYGYTGTVPQVSGNFVTTPNNNTINDLIVTNTSGLTLTNPITVSGTTYGSENIEGNDTLPVTLSSFSASVGNDSKVRIRWITQSETNCDGYYLYRSRENDLATAQRISSLIGAVNSSQGGSYEYIDLELSYDGFVYYWLEDVSFDGEVSFHGPVVIKVSNDHAPNTPDIPIATGLQNIYPNPFNPSTSIKYQLEVQGDVLIEMYNAKGQKVDRYELSNQARGKHTLVWNTQSMGLPSGVYFVKFSSGTKTDVRKIVMSK